MFARLEEKLVNKGAGISAFRVNRVPAEIERTKLLHPRVMFLSNSEIAKQIKSLNTK